MRTLNRENIWPNSLKSCNWLCRVACLLCVRICWPYHVVVIMVVGFGKNVYNQPPHPVVVVMDAGVGNCLWPVSASRDGCHGCRCILTKATLNRLSYWKPDKDGCLFFCVTAQWSCLYYYVVMNMMNRLVSGAPWSIWHLLVYQYSFNWWLLRNCLFLLIIWKHSDKLWLVWLNTTITEAVL